MRWRGVCRLRRESGKMLESAFFQDLAMLMTAAGVVAAIFARLGWPKVIGYILAGIFMSEYTWGGSFLADAGSVKIIGQLGVVFLMFGMGLSFSARDMKKMKSIAFPTAAFDVVGMILVGYAVGTKVFGWSPVESVFLGVAICDSATTMLAKVIDEMGWGRRMFAKYVLGTSVCEDILTVGAIAVATGFANGSGMSPGALFASLGWLAVFFLTVLVFGFIFVPRMLKSVAKSRDDESLLLVLLGVCFFVSFFAYKFDFSLALGAFLVGLLGSSSDVRQRLEGLVAPLKSMFSAVFFVSIGLMVDPAELWRFLQQILFLSAIVTGFKMFNTTVMPLLTGADLKTSVQMGFSLAQIGEFSFMVAILYVGLCGDAKSDLFPVAVGTSLLTTLLNPLMVRFSDPAGEFVVRRAPACFKRWLSTYQAWLAKIRGSDDSPSLALLRVAATKLVIYAVLMLAVSVVCAMMYQFDYSRFSEYFEKHDKLFFFFIANFFSVGLVPMVIFAARALADEIAELLAGDGSAKWRMAIRQMIRFFVQGTVVALFFIEWAAINMLILPISGEVQGAALVAIVAIGAIGWSTFVKAGRRATKRFQEALTVQERSEGLVRMTSVSVPEGTIHRIELRESSRAIGETVVSLNVRAKTGASVVSVYRDGQITRNIGPEWTFEAGDVVVALGDRLQIAALKNLLGASA